MKKDVFKLTGFKKNTMFANFKKKGYITLLTVLIIGSVGGVIVASMILLGIGSSLNSLSIDQSTQAKSLANACAEEGLQQIRDDVPFTGTDTINFSQGECTYVVTSSGGQNRHITAESTVGTIVRRVDIYIDSITPEITIVSWQEVNDL